MASSSSAKRFSLFVFFLAISFSASYQVEGREGRLFFSKVTRLIGTVDKGITEVPTPSPTPTPTPNVTPAPAPAPETSESVPAPALAPVTGFGAESESGYGLYRTRETPANEMLTEEFGGEEGSGNGYGKSNYKMDSGRGRGRGKYYWNNGYENEKSGSEQQGMSDTRFLENGRYHHDVKNGNENGSKYYYNGYDDQTAERGPRYVFDSMEEYEKYQESQGTYWP